MVILVEIDGLRVYVYWQRGYATYDDHLSIVTVQGNLPATFTRRDVARAAAWVSRQTGSKVSTQRLVVALESYRLVVRDYAYFGIAVTEEDCRRWFPRTWPAALSRRYWEIRLEDEEEMRKEIEAVWVQAGLC
jgi:hypothetical protein